MPNIVVVYHSGYGHTAKQAQAVLEGARAGGADASLVAVGDITDATWETLAKADALIFGAPTYMGSLSAPFKDFMDKSSKVWFTQGWHGKIAGGFTNSASMNGDKLNSLVQLAVFAAQHGMIWVGTGLMPAADSKAQRNDVNFLGSFLGAMAQSPADAGPDVAPPPGDLETAKRYGQRIAEVTARYVRGGTA